MTRARRWTAAVAATLAATVAAMIGVGPVPGAATAADGPSSDELISEGEHDVYFSPNADGRHDRARFTFHLSSAARVAAIVRDRTGDVVRLSKLGLLDAGRHQWTWGGRTTAGGVAPDGEYTVVLRAVSGPFADRVTMRAVARTSVAPGRLVMSRPTVYPNATAVHDRLQMVHIRYGFRQIVFENLGFFGPEKLLRTRMVIRDPSGATVFEKSSREYRPAFEWDARADDGSPLPEGSYPLRFRVQDPAGNRATIRRVVEVSWDQLVQQTWSVTTSAAATPRGPGPIYDPGCNGCGEVCGPVASDRFVNGLSFRPCEFGYASVAHYGTTPPVTPAPVDSYRLTASGGPTTPGAADVANFAGVPIGPGDVTVSTQWRPVALTSYPFVPKGLQPVTWGFSTSEDNSYDLASMTVEYRYYVPVP